MGEVKWILLKYVEVKSAQGLVVMSRAIRKQFFFLLFSYSLRARHCNVYLLDRLKNTGFLNPEQLIVRMLARQENFERVEEFFTVHT